MRFVGLDLGGVNSLACVRDEAGDEMFQPSAFPARPSIVLFPLVRKERLLVGDEALRSERGSGLPWPPLASADPAGWCCAVPPASRGRVLLTTVWQRLVEGEQWPEPQWQPPDGLPPVSKPAPPDCLTAEARTVLKRALGNENGASIALAIPNQLPEESQDALLVRLPSGARLVWRAVAAAMAWAEDNCERIGSGTRLAVLDVGVDAVEISIFEFRQQETSDRVFQVPIRRLNRLHTVNTGNLITDSPAPFAGILPDLGRLEHCLSDISKVIEAQTELAVCGPLADTLVSLLQRRFSQLTWPTPDAHMIARGSALFAWRLARGWPTYLDVLPSLELFTLTEEHEPRWLVLIPPDCEASGGQDFQRVQSKRVFIEQGTIRLASWLQRSGEKDFRKLTTDLPVEAARDAWVDLQVSARSAGGFARVCMTPSRGEFEVFGAGKSVLLNWQNMERLARSPGDKWPKGIVKFGWPACGKLYAHRPLFEDFLAVAQQELTKALTHPSANQRLSALGVLKLRVAKTIAPQLAGVAGAAGDAAPVNLLVCLGTDTPCEFLEPGFGGQARVTAPLPSKDAEVQRVAGLLWQRLKTLAAAAKVVPGEVKALFYILGRLGGYAPEAFREHVARNLYPTSKRDLLFAAGRVLDAAEHGRRLFAVINDKANLYQALNNNWLRMMVYVLYQRTDVLRDVPRQHVLSAIRLCLDSFQQQVLRANVRILFMNSLRALALLLRARRTAQARDLLCAGRCPADENQVAQQFKQALQQATAIRLRPTAQTLVERVTDWLDFRAATDEMPPIAPPDEAEEPEESEDEHENDSK